MTWERGRDHDGVLDGFQDRERRRPTAKQGSERMSWSKSFTGKAFADAEERAAARASVVEQNGEEAAAQFDAASKAAQGLVDSGSVGGEGKDFNIYLSGHSNPGHEPKPGWSNDTVSISVSQATVPATAGV